MAQGQEAQRSDLQLKRLLPDETEAQAASRGKGGVFQRMGCVRGLCELGIVRSSVTYVCICYDCSSNQSKLCYSPLQNLHRKLTISP